MENDDITARHEAITAVSQCAMKLEDELANYEQYLDGYRGESYGWSNLEQCYLELQFAWTRLVGVLATGHP